jgi:hypothetical protein
VKMHYIELVIETTAALKTETLADVAVKALRARFDLHAKRHGFAPVRINSRVYPTPKLQPTAKGSRNAVGVRSATPRRRSKRP